MAVVVLAPLVRPGFVLRYDMVFVPRQPLSWSLVAPTDSLPRAVPLDAVVGVASLAVPGWLLQRIVLVAVLAVAVVGAGRLVPGARPATRLVAGVGYAWTPLLAERLLLGQWGLLLCYAVLPWLVAAARAARTGRPGAGARVVLLAAVASVTPTGGVIAFAVTVAVVAGRVPAWAAGTPVTAGSRRRRGLRGTRVGATVVAAAVLNAPWLLAALGSAAPARSDAAGVAAFAARAENWAGPLAALAGTGGIWNAEATPASRGSVLAPLCTVLVLGLAAFGWPRLRRRWPDGTGTRVTVLAVGAVLLAAAGTVPGGAAALRAAAGHVPGGGLLRDGQKWLIPYALWLAVCLALGAERLAERVAARSAPLGGRLVLLGGVLLPLAVLPDLAYGVGGRLRPVEYPADWAVVARLVAADPGPVVSLPLSAYRAYPWNAAAVVIDPAPRYLPAQVIVDDRLRVGALTVAGEDPLAATIRNRVAAGQPAADAAVRWVLVQHGVGGVTPATALAGLDAVHDGRWLTLYRNPHYAGHDTPVPAPAVVGYLLAAGTVAGAVGARLRRREGDLTVRAEQTATGHLDSETHREDLR